MSHAQHLTESLLCVSFSLSCRTIDLQPSPTSHSPVFSFPDAGCHAPGSLQKQGDARPWWWTSMNENNHILSQLIRPRVCNTPSLKPRSSALVTPASLFLYHLLNMYCVSGAVTLSKHFCPGSICCDRRKVQIGCWWRCGNDRHRCVGRGKPWLRSKSSCIIISDSWAVFSVTRLVGK